MFNPKNLLILAAGYGLYWAANTPDGRRLAGKAIKMCANEIGGLEGAVLKAVAGRKPESGEKKEKDNADAL